MNPRILNLFCKTFTTTLLILATLQIIGKSVVESSKPDIIDIEGGPSLPDVEYNITKCNPKLSNVINGEVVEIIPNGNCVNLYQEENCQGHFVRYIPGSVDYLFSPEVYKWVDDDGFVTRPFLVHSVGPCYDRCDPRNWEGDNTSTTTVTFYNDNAFRGCKMRVELNNEGCYPLEPSNMKWRSLKISGDESTSCVELHSDVTCAGKFTQFRPGYPELFHLNYLRLGGGIGATLAKAVSRCGSFCKTIKPGPEERPGIGVINYDHYGNNVTNDKVLDTMGGGGLPIWMLFLLSFCGILLLIGAALLGAFISKRYEKISHGVSSERFNVLYKLEPSTSISSSF